MFEYLKFSSIVFGSVAIGLALLVGFLSAYALQERIINRYRQAYAALSRAFHGSDTFSVTERGEEALADAYAREQESRDSPGVMCGCGNCAGDLGPTTLALHDVIQRALYAPALDDALASRKTADA